MRSALGQDAVRVSKGEMAAGGAEVSGGAIAGLVDVDGVDAGVLVLRWEPDALYLSLIELLPAFQGRGVGTAVLQSLIARAAARGLPVTLHVLKANAAARRFYARHGFAVVADEHVRYKMQRMP